MNCIEQHLVSELDRLTLTQYQYGSQFDSVLVAIRLNHCECM